MLLTPADDATDIKLRPTLIWNESAGATAYSLVVADNPGFSDPIVTVQRQPWTTSYVIASDLDPSVTYYWKVTAHGKGGDMPCGAGFSFTTRLGSVWSWGYSEFGQTGDDATASHSLAQYVIGPDGSGLDGVAAVSAGFAHSLALGHDGTVWAWGRNTTGELGNGTKDGGPVPAKVLGEGGTGELPGIVAISAGEDHSLALGDDGTVWAWGANYYGQLGDATTSDRLTPIHVVGSGGSGHLAEVVAISAGYGHSIALRNDGTIWAWGNNCCGQIGDNTTETRLLPTQVVGPGGDGFMMEVIAVSAGDDLSMAVKADGTVWSWGSGELGDNTNSTSAFPVQAFGEDGHGFLTGAAALGTGSSHSLVLIDDGTARAWGSSSFGQLGDGSTIGHRVPVNVLASGGNEVLADIAALSAGGYHSLALGADGEVWAWGYNLHGQVGDGTVISRSLPARVLDSCGTGSLSEVASVSAGGYHSLALKSDGTVWAWGRNGFGQLGVDTGMERRTPVCALDSDGSGQLTGIVSASAGEWFTVASRSDGSVWTWGYNEFGQLGNGTATASFTPLRVYDWAGDGYLSDVATVSAGGSHVLALKHGGSVWSWGSNWYGQLGNGVPWTFESLPVQVHGPDGVGFVSDIVAISAGYNHSVALRSDGAVLAWGSPMNNELGTGTSSYSIPGQVVGPYGEGYLTDVVAVSAGMSHTLALKADGTVWAWGYNSFGELGVSSTSSSDCPVQVRGKDGNGYLAGIVAVSAGWGRSAALRSDGTVWTWGSGRLGDGTNLSSSSPIQVLGPGGEGFLREIVAVAAGGSHTLALKEDGTVWAWGRNIFGQLGDDTTVNRSTPIQVLGSGGVGFLTGKLGIDAGETHSIAW